MCVCSTSPLPIYLASGQHFVPIIDPGIGLTPGYEAYERGLREQLFVRDVTGESFSMGQVWPGPVYFPDFTHPSTQVVCFVNGNVSVVRF